MRYAGPRRRIFLIAAVLGAIVVVGAGLAGLYALWSPGLVVTDGRHDLGTNGIWIQHGWLGDDQWFRRLKRDPGRFRDAASIRRLRELLERHNMLYVFPHLCPCLPDGTIAAVDKDQTERFLREFEDFQVMPWVGGVLGKQAFLGSPEWRNRFVSSVVELMNAHPEFAGVHVNIEPVPTGNADLLRLLRDLRRALPDGFRLSVAAYPPPTILHPFSQVHWEEEYLRRISGEVDQVVVMMYDTAIKFQKPYIDLMSRWTGEILRWAGYTEVLLGLPAYDDFGARYHTPKVENLANALLGVHRGLRDIGTVPAAYRGIAIYSEWEMDEGEWSHLRSHFLRN